MDLRAVIFIFVSMAVHAGVLSLLTVGTYASSGLAAQPDVIGPRPGLRVHLIAPSPPAANLTHEPPGNLQSDTAPSSPAPASPPVTFNRSPTQQLSPAVLEQVEKVELKAAPSISDDNFIPAGELTRLPVPLNRIRLDTADIRALGFQGTIVLTIMVDTNGIVSRVYADAKTETETERKFVESVSDRFRRAYFLPGELNGNPVKAQIQITVVSEALPAYIVQQPH